MTKDSWRSTDPDIQGALKALRRAARRALELGLRTGTPVYVLKDGKIIDLTAQHRTRPPSTRTESKRKPNRR